MILVAIAAFPLKPLQSLFMGVGCGAVLVAALAKVGLSSSQVSDLTVPVLGIFLVAVIATLLTIVIYRERAAAAIAPGGRITIRSNQTNGSVVLEVEDDGKGIPAEQLAHLFDPMFRVEKGRMGTSWGLFVSRRIVSEQGGQLEIASTPGMGTTARIVLPLGLAEAA